eukprot:GEMP01028476.1.p5 GENE.GEMP01028476.1~~GEMP01028476.1.p5  ORF type:complete len:113 (-),score=14.95 GEMP01028476.1:1110-1448(-)
MSVSSKNHIHQFQKSGGGAKMLHKCSGEKMSVKKDQENGGNAHKRAPPICEVTVFFLLQTNKKRREPKNGVFVLSSTTWFQVVGEKKKTRVKQKKQYNGVFWFRFLFGNFTQ